MGEKFAETDEIKNVSGVPSLVSLRPQAEVGGPKSEIIFYIPFFLCQNNIYQAFIILVPFQAFRLAQQIGTHMKVQYSMYNQTNNHLNVESYGFCNKFSCL